MAPLPARLILYDGVCGFCNRSVRWIIRADRRGLFHFAPLQGDTAAAIRARHPELPSDLDSIIYVRQLAGREVVSWRAAAIFEICRELQLPWSMLSWWRWLPAAAADLGYRYFAANRYRWFGKYDECPLPSADERARFLL